MLRNSSLDLDFLLPFGSFETYLKLKKIYIDPPKNLSTPFWEFRVSEIERDQCWSTIKSIRLSTPFWEFQKNVDKIDFLRDYLKHLSTPFWEFRNTDHKVETSNHHSNGYLSTPFWEFLSVDVLKIYGELGRYSFYSLLGVSDRIDYITFLLAEKIQNLFLLPFGSFLMLSLPQQEPRV